MTADQHDFDERYRTGDLPWDTGWPSTELMRVVAAERVAPCRAIDLGCGTGSNAVWLAQQGFDAVGVDLSPRAIELAQARAAAAGVTATFLAADLCDLPDLGAPFAFCFDRGCYHHVRTINLPGYLGTLQKILTGNARGLVLAGNAREPQDPGPPVVSEQELRDELGTLFEIVRLQEFRFDLANPSRPLGWSCFVRRR